MNAPVLAIEDLCVSFGPVEVVHGVDVSVAPGEMVALVGESGSGKSVTALATMGLLGRGGRVTGGRIWLDGRDIAGLPETELLPLRGPDMAMIFQDPGTALNPAFSIGRQITDVLRAHRSLSRTAAREEAAALLTSVGISEADRRLSLYPHELSGGMRQRVMIAMAAACQPRLLIADEPTTALDVTVQAQVVTLLRDLCARRGIALLFISHNLDLVAEFCDRIVVMYRGRVVETARTEELFSAPRHPYTRLLLDAVMRPGQPARAPGKPALSASAAPGACSFLPRCPVADARCGQRPDLVGEGGHLTACWQETSS
jgi:oligopeptide/dipeptide ABC transporter ATP-binding protein